MDFQNLISSLEQQLTASSEPVLDIASEDLYTLSESQAEQVMRHFAHRALMKLPQHEIEFFEWLKKEDNTVWRDLWEEAPALYVVSVHFLKLLLPGGGFPICDLIATDNFWFTQHHIKPDGIALLQDVMEKLRRHETLSVSEGLLCEAYFSGIDVWHFAYKYHIPLYRAKQAVQQLVEDDMLTHLTNRDDLVDSMEF